MNDCTLAGTLAPTLPPTADAMHLAAPDLPVCGAGLGNRLGAR